MPGVAVPPAPVSETVCGLSGALSVSVSVPLRFPLAPGVKVTLIAQFAPGAMADVQVFVCAKSLALVPLIAILLIVNEADPLFVTVIVCGELGVPTGTVPKSRLVGFKLTSGVGDELPMNLFKILAVIC